MPLFLRSLRVFPGVGIRLNSSEEQRAEAIWPVNTFLAGGYYSLDLFGGQLKVIGLNTMAAAPLLPGVLPFSALHPPIHAHLR
jgi:hypothetical protein